jgi:hypothetical protein
MRPACIAGGGGILARWMLSSLGANSGGRVPAISDHKNTTINRPP